MDPQSSRKIQNPLACLALLYFLFFSSFKVTEEENNQFSKVPFNLIIQHQQKRVQETPPKSKPKTHQRPKKKKKGGSGEESGGGGGAVRAGGLQIVSPSTRRIFSRLEIYCTIYTCFGCHTYTRTRGHSHILSSRKSRHPTVTNTHKHSRSHKPVQ